MRVLRAALAICLTMATLVVLTAGPAGACSCTRATPESEFANADAVFLGTVVSHSDSSNGNAKGHFTVERVYKGAVQTRQTVVSASSSAACGLTLPSNSTFLMSGSTSDEFLNAGHLEAGQLAATLCDGVIADGLARHDPSVIRLELHPPTPSTRRPRVVTS